VVFFFGLSSYPCSYEGLIQFNQQVYYSGNKLEINLGIPDQLKALLKADAEAHILVYFPQGEIEAFPARSPMKANCWKPQ